MTSLFSYLLTFFGIAYWFFRVIVTLLYQLDMDFFAQPINLTAEITVLFLTLPCILLVVKRNIVGAAAYLGIYVTYFGTALYETILGVQATGLDLVNSSNMLCIIVGVIIPLLTFLDILFNKNRSMGKDNKKGDWFYKNEAFDRDFDERADRNQYKINR
ncbi:MAG: hypothetical protein IKL55_04465 [Clostridia bacterium]|nr:hypothetical protein [Clostridia bacterium]